DSGRNPKLRPLKPKHDRHWLVDGGLEQCCVMETPARNLEPIESLFDWNKWLQAFKSGRAPETADRQDTGELFLGERRFGHTRAPSGSTEEGKLYSRSVTRVFDSYDERQMKYT